MSSRQDIARFFSRSALRKAEDYWANERVRLLEATDDLSHICAQVQGTLRQPYEVDIELRWTAGQIRAIDGHCTCPMSYNCKHVAAAVLTAVEGEAEIDRTSATASREAVRAFAPLAARPKEGTPPPLPPDVSSWLEQVTRVPRGEDYPPEIRQRLIYILQPMAVGTQMPRAAVTLHSVRLLKEGGLAESLSRVALSNSLSEQAPKFYRDSDLDILSLLRRESGGYLYSGIVPVPSCALIEKIVATGRAYWINHLGPPLRWAAGRPGGIEWRLVGIGGSRPHLLVEGTVALNADLPIYVDERTGEIGPVELGLPARLAHRLLSAPLIPREQTARVAQLLAQKLPDLPRELLPAEPEAPQRIEQDPIPVLRLMRGTPGPYYGIPSPVARLWFRYGPVEIAANESAPEVDAYLDGRLYAAVRRPRREKEARDRVRRCGFAPATRVSPYLDREHRNDFGFTTAREWLEFLDSNLQELRRQGFEIQVDDDFPYRLAPSSGVIDAEFEGTGIDWFELKLGMEIDGQRHDVVPAIAALLASERFSREEVEGLAGRSQSLFLPLADGRHVALAAARVLPLLLALHSVQLGGRWGDGSKKVEVSRADVLPLLGFETPDFRFLGADNLRRLADLVRSQELARPVLPPDFKGVLRPYQSAGVAWLDLLREAGLGGILADDMGLGKTVQVLALLAMEQARASASHPSLVVCPTSLVENWRNEVRKFAPTLKVLVLHGLRRKQHFASIPHHDLVITTYPLISRDQEALLSREWHAAVLDEAQVIKNPAAATTRALRDIKARHRFCLTGTPMENHLGELWSLMNFANPGYLGDKTAFARTWRTPIEKRGDEERATALRRRIKPFLLRRAKAEVASELPPKSEIVESIVLEGAQRDLYDAVRISMADKVRKAIAERGLARSHIVVLEALLRLRQVCCDPRLLKLDDSVERPSGKLERLMEMVPELLSEGRKLIVFSQFTSMLELIRLRLDAAAIRYSLLTGETRNRQAAIDRFQDGTNDVFLVSLKAGGVGLNLTAADTVVIFDPWWNPAVEEQAIDRAHRIGQDKAVFVYRLMASGTIEEKMDELKARKRALADGLYDREGRMSSALTEQDVVALFEA
jgi:superfamily II DNA or RNA helicase